jgi:type II secretory pathway pseudopilin PulG
MRHDPKSGFTLVEIVLGAVTLAIVTSAVLGAYVGQITLNEHARNLSLAVQDANRVIEAIREDNAGCTAPDIVPDDGSTSWDQWMSTGGAGDGIVESPAMLTTLVTCR